MEVTRSLKGIIEIHLAGTPVSGAGTPHRGEGVINLSPYGAKRFAYELLLQATDAEWYASHSGAMENTIQLMKEGKIPLTSQEKENDMPKIKCTYFGMSDEDISIHFEDHHIVLAEKPTQPMTQGCTHGSCMSAYSFLTPDQAESLGKQLITAAAKKRKDDSK